MVIDRPVHPTLSKIYADSHQRASLVFLQRDSKRPHRAWHFLSVNNVVKSTIHASFLLKIGCGGDPNR